jgi:hypothetical protein
MMPSNDVLFEDYLRPNELVDGNFWVPTTSSRAMLARDDAHKEDNIHPQSRYWFAWQQRAFWSVLEIMQ